MMKNDNDTRLAYNLIHWVLFFCRYSAGAFGYIKLDQFHYDTAANWPRRTACDSGHAAGVAAGVARRAVNDLLARQDSTGLFISWLQEPFRKAHLYDPALVLSALIREGAWRQRSPAKRAARAAQDLVAFLKRAQQDDGHWARTGAPHSGAQLSAGQYYTW